MGLFDSAVNVGKSIAKYSNPVVYAADAVKDRFGNPLEGLEVSYSGDYGNSWQNTPTSNRIVSGNDGATQSTANYNQTSGTGRSTGTASRGPAYDPNDLAYLNSQEALYNNLMARLDNTRNIGLRNIDNQYQSGLDKANTSYSKAKTAYDTQEQDTKTKKVDAFGKVDANTNSLAASVRRILGLAGAAGSSAMDDLQGGIAKVASQNRSGVLGDYATNMRGLTTARKDSETDYNALLGELDSQKRQGRENFEAGVLGQRQTLNNSLSDIAARRAQLLGQNPANALRGYTDRYLGYQDQIDALPNQYFKGITARDVKSTPVSLKDYMVDRAAINANREMGAQPNSPYAQFLKKQQEEEIL